MADFYPTVVRAIEVGHSDPRCGVADHGHRMTLEVTLKGTYDAQTGHSAKVEELEAALDELLKEINLRPLSVISPAQPTFEGLGLWVIERLLPSFPKIVEVLVWRDPLRRYSITREPR